MPKVSVILTSFNHEKFIREAIESVLNQTFADFELIIWDDASSDNSWHLIRQYSDPRIIAFRNEKQERGIWGINKSISEVATGEYIAIHHSDDVWELDKLAKQVAFLETNPETGAVFTWAQIIDEHGVQSTKDWFDQGNKTRWEWLNQLFHEENHLNHPSVLIRKQCYQDVGAYRYGFGQTGDAEMWSRVLIKFPIHIIQEKLTRHRIPSDRSNTSGHRIEVVIRASNEWNVLRLNYLLIANFEDIVATFPNLERFRNPKGFDNKFLLAMACLYECKQRSAWQLGLTWLFDLLNDKTRYEKVRKLYSFSYLDFIRLTAEFNVYFAERDEQIASLNGQIASLDGQVASLIAERHYILNSASWRITKPLRFLYPVAPVLFRRLTALTWRLRERMVLLQNPPAQCRPYQVRVMGSYSADRPRVVHALANFYLGGSSRLVVDLVEHLSHRYEQEVITKVQPDPPSYTGVRVHEYRMDESKQVSQRVFRYLCEFKPSICHVHYWGELDRSWYEAVMKAADQFGCHVIENINTPITPIGGERIARYVYVSDYVLDTFGQRNGKSFTVYPGSDLRLFVRKDMLDIPNDCIGMVYRLEGDKLTEQSIDVFIKVVKRRPSTRVLMVGGGRFLKSYKKAVQSHGVMEAFQFTGYVAYEDLPVLYQGMSIFVAPVWKESFGHVSVLAMNCGIPVVGYNVGALAEIIGDRDLLAPSGDSDRLADIVVELLQDREKRLSIGLANQKRAQALFSVEAMITRYSKLYQSVLEQGL